MSTEGNILRQKKADLASGMRNYRELSRFKYKLKSGDKFLIPSEISLLKRQGLSQIFVVGKKYENIVELYYKAKGKRYTLYFGYNKLWSHFKNNEVYCLEGLGS